MIAAEASSIGFSLPTWLSIIVGLLGLAATAAGVSAVFRANLAKETINQLKENNEALEGRVVFLESENERLHKSVRELTSTNQILEKLVRGTNELAEFQKRILDVEAAQSQEHDKILATHSTQHDRIIEALLEIDRKLA